MRRFVIINEHRYPNSSNIIEVKPDTNCSRLVEQWQLNSLHYAVRHTLPSITWCVHNGDFVSAMIKSSKIV